MSETSVRMSLATLAEIPTCDLPDGFNYRDYAPGDCDMWVELYKTADDNPKITAQLFANQFHGDDDELAKRMFFIYEGGTAVGTSTAWYGKQVDDPAGRVHWVAIHQDYRGRGLSKPLLSETLTRLRRLGHTRAYLITATERTPAIHLYLKFGFVPEPRNDEERHAWQKWGEANGYSWDGVI